MPRQCRDPKCIANKKRLTAHKYRNKRKASRPSTSHRNSLDNPTGSREKKTQKLTKIKSSRWLDRGGSKNLRTKNLFNQSRGCKNKKCQASQSTTESSTSTYPSQKLRVTSAESTKPNVSGRVSDNSRNYTKQICTCGKEHRNSRGGNSHERANLQSASAEMHKRRRKRSRRRRKKVLKRESDRPRRHDCFTTLCVCVRGRSSDELRTCKCTSPREIPSSRHKCCCVKGGQKGTKRSTRKSTSKNDTQLDRHIADPSASERQPAFKHPHELSPVKLNEERSVIIRGLGTVRRGIDRLGAYAIRLFTGNKQ